MGCIISAFMSERVPEGPGGAGDVRDVGGAGHPVGLAERNSADAFAETVAPVSVTPLMRASTETVALLDTHLGVAPPDAPKVATSRNLSDQFADGHTITAPASGSSQPRGRINGAPTDHNDSSVHNPSGLPMVSSDHYVAERELARGGMGRIISARDRRLGRPVAIKELLTVVPDAAQRFRREALITARLQHPGIVPVYEAGCWPSGEPFYAMKMVGGRPLDRVIAEATTLVDRLALLPRLAAATDAIAYAHSHRVIHRDLKPANILVGEFGETIVIDWGLAKDLDATDSDHLDTQDHQITGRGKKSPSTIRADEGDGSLLTVAGSVMGTPAYMAPEQARGEALDERADVFALGAMMYHVLGGAPPFQAATTTDVLAAAASGRVQPLAKRSPDVPSDLIAIVERAMAKDPAQRYANAGELAVELRRFLTGQLVAAYRYTPLEKARRFVRRHRAAVTISLLASLGFAVGGTVAVRRVVKARDFAERQRELAVSRKHAAETLVDYMVTNLSRRLEPIGHLYLLSDLGDEVRKYYNELDHTPGGVAPADVDRMAKALRLLAHAAEQSGHLNDAIAIWREAKTRLSAVISSTDKSGDETTQTDADERFARQLLIAQTDVDIGRASAARGEVVDAQALLHDAATTLAAMIAIEPTNRDVLLAYADAHDELGNLLRNAGKLDEGLAEYAEARLQRDRVVAAAQGNGDRAATFALSTSHLKIGSVLEARGETSEALGEYRTCGRLRESLNEADPDNPQWESGLVQTRGLIGDLQRQLGDVGSSIATYNDTLSIAESLVHRDPDNTDWRRAFGNMLSDLGLALVDRGEFQTALSRYQEAITSHRELVSRDTTNTAWQIDLARILTRTADAYLAVGDTTNALASCDEGHTIRAALVARDAGNTIWRRALAGSDFELGLGYIARHGKGDADSALASLESSLAARTQLAQQATSHAAINNELAIVEIILGNQLQHGSVDADRKRGATLLNQGIDRIAKIVAGDQLNTAWKQTLTTGLLLRGRNFIAGGKLDRAHTDLSSAVTIANTAHSDAPLNAYWQGVAGSALDALADVDRAQGRAEDAADHEAAALALLESLQREHHLSADHQAVYDRLRH